MEGWLVLIPCFHREHLKQQRKFLQPLFGLDRSALGRLAHLLLHKLNPTRQRRLWAQRVGVAGCNPVQRGHKASRSFAQSRSTISMRPWNGVSPNWTASGSYGTSAALLSLAGPNGAQVCITLNGVVQGLTAADLIGGTPALIPGGAPYPINGGNGTDYRTWAQDATDANGNPVSSAQIFAYVYPNYYGVGSPLG